jgi:Inovirus Coat protein B
MKLFKQSLKYGSTALLLASLNSAHAAVDVSAVVAEISGSNAPIAAIGAAVLIVMVGTKVFKWINRAM